MIFEHIITGGPIFMVPVVALGIASLFLSGMFFMRYKSRTKSLAQLQKQANLIVFLGSFAFLLGLLGQVIGLWEAFAHIHKAGSISMGIVAEGLRVSMIAPLYGFVFFILSLLIWFVLRNHLLPDYEQKA